MLGLPGGDTTDDEPREDSVEEEEDTTIVKELKGSWQKLRIAYDKPCA